MTANVLYFDGGAVLWKKCYGQCKRRRHVSCFGPNRAKKDGLDNYCKDCRREYGKLHQRKRRADPLLKDYFRDLDLRKNFGISLIEYNELLDHQNGVCGICGDPPINYNLAVDHDHETGEIRGLLCKACNRGLGMFGDNVDRLLAAVAYLG